MPWQSAIVFALGEWERAKEWNAELAWSNKYAYQERAWHSLYNFPCPVVFFFFFLAAFGLYYILIL